MVSAIRIVDTSRGDTLLVPRTRLNVESSSGREGVERSSRLQGTDRQAFAAFLGRLCDLIGEYHRDSGSIHALRSDRAPEARRWLLYPIWPSEGGTGVAAAPGSLKSYAAQAIAVSVATGVPVLRGHTRTVGDPKRVLILDWEGHRGEAEQRQRALCLGRGVDPEGRVHYREMRRPLMDSIHDLVTRVVDYDGVIIDSVSAAIGGSLLEDDRVNQFWDAVRALGVPALVIAHKSKESSRKRESTIFGSIMNEARIRMGWNVETLPHSTTVRWDCFKDSNGSLLYHRMAWQWEFVNQGAYEDAVLETVQATPVDPKNVALVSNDRTVADEIGDVLKDGATTVRELAVTLGRGEQVIRTQLNRHKDRFTKLPDGMRWGIADDQGQTTPIPY